MGNLRVAREGYGFADENGNDIDCDRLLTFAEAKELCQQHANRLGTAVSCWLLDGEDRTEGDWFCSPEKPCSECGEIHTNDTELCDWCEAQTP